MEVEDDLVVVVGLKVKVRVTSKRAKQSHSWVRKPVNDLEYRLLFTRYITLTLISEDS